MMRSGKLSGEYKYNDAMVNLSISLFNDVYMILPEKTPPDIYESLTDVEKAIQLLIDPDLEYNLDVDLQ